ncbi:Uncharacterised protein [Mycobacteroides abscessus subsp. abscessus]|nr:Uncharacterised protein [Mycobacteroides abscessus subsp. abscessus]
MPSRSGACIRTNTARTWVAGNPRVSLLTAIMVRKASGTLTAAG